MKHSSKSNIDNIGNNIRHSLKNVLFKDHVSVKIKREKNKDNREFRFQLISTKRLKKIIIGLDCNKSNLNGSIPANVLKDRCNTFISYLTEIINNSFQTGNSPNELKLAEVMPVYKKNVPIERKTIVCERFATCFKNF